MSKPNTFLEYIDSFANYEDLLKDINYDANKLNHLWFVFNLELFDFNTSHAIAKRNNEKSLEYYVDEGRKFDKREALLRAAIENNKEEVAC